MSRTRANAPASDGEREPFFAAQARHRAAGRRWSLFAGLLLSLLAATVAALLAPILWAVAGLLLDLPSRAVEAPNLLGAIARLLDQLTGGGVVSPVQLAGIVALALSPGLAVLSLAWWRMDRLARATHGQAFADALAWREPHRGDLEEMQLRNLVEEMSVAAVCTPPQLVLIDDAACNLGLVSTGGHTTLAVTRGLIDRLPRDQTQALVGQLVAAMGNGDGRLGDHLVRCGELAGLLMLLAQATLSRKARAALLPLLGLRASDDPALLAAARAMLADPMSLKTDAGDSQRTSWRDWLLMPLMGSLMVGVVVVPIAWMFFVEPSFALVWRRRRLLADATAVQFTRDPQALARAYASLADLPTGLGIAAPWLANVFALDAGAAPGKMVSPYPSLATRVARLNRQGAEVAPPQQATRARIPPWAFILLLPLLALVAGLMLAVIALGVMVSLMLNLLFLGLPVGLLHVLLRG